MLFRSQGVPNAKFQVMNALAMDFPDDTFDLVWACESGEHMPDKKKYVEEMIRVLKPGGTIVIATWCQRETPPEFTDTEKANLKFLYEEWAHPYFISIEEYASLVEGTTTMRDVDTDDWTRQTIASWRHSIWAGVWDPIPVFSRPNIWYKTLDIAAGIIQIVDESRPVSTAHGELPQNDVLAYGKNIDMWGMNVYRWDKPASILREWRLKEVNKPMYYSEAGGDSYMTTSQLGYSRGESQEAQADANENILKEIFKNQKHNAGVMLFQFTDGWWKAGNPDQQDKGGAAPNSGGVPYDGSANEEYWGVVDIDRNKKLTYEVVKKIYSEN